MMSIDEHYLRSFSLRLWNIMEPKWHHEILKKTSSIGASFPNNPRSKKNILKEFLKELLKGPKLERLQADLMLNIYFIVDCIF